MIRATTKLLVRLGIRPDATPAPSTGALGDWFATMLQVRRGRFVLAISEVTLMPVVVAGRDLATLPARLADAVAEVLRALDIPGDAIERERRAMSEVSFARTSDRSTVGVLTDLQRSLRFDLEDDPTRTLLERSLRLAHTPIVARDLFPDLATRALFGTQRRVCGHPLCELVGGDCSLASGVSRGCRTGPRVAAPFEAELVAEVADLLAQLGAAPDAAAAARLAVLFRREARRDRNLLGLATDELLDPALAQRLLGLCRRRATGPAGS